MNSNKLKVSKLKFSKLLIVTFILTFTLVGCNFNPFFVANINDDNTGSNNESNESKKNAPNTWQDPATAAKLDEIQECIDEFYYFPVDSEIQDEAFYDGIMAGLDDPYAAYYTKEEHEALLEDNSGEYVGIGAVVTQDADRLIKVVRPVPGSPAEEVGIEPEDIIVEVGGVEIIDQDLELVVKMIRGEEGTVAHVKVFRASIDDFIEFDITRRLVENVTVFPEMREYEGHKIGYIEMTQFVDTTFGEFKEAVEDLTDQGAKGLIVDIRDNPGGLLSSVIDITSYCVDGGTILTTKDKDEKVIDEYTDKDDNFIDLPLAVLVNENSASASEILAADIQETGSGILVGAKTFGKGIVQTLIPLKDETAIKLTIYKYFTADGTDIHGEGVTPDHVVALPDGKINAGTVEEDEDTQLHKAYELLEEMIKE